MIVVNPRNHEVKSAILWMRRLGFSQLFVSETFFWHCLVKIQLLNLKRSREVGLYKVPLVF